MHGIPLWSRAVWTITWCALHYGRRGGSTPASEHKDCGCDSLWSLRCSLRVTVGCLEALWLPHSLQTHACGAELVTNLVIVNVCVFLSSWDRYPVFCLLCNRDLSLFRPQVALLIYRGWVLKWAGCCWLCTRASAIYSCDSDAKFHFLVNLPLDV